MNINMLALTELATSLSIGVAFVWPLYLLGIRHPLVLSATATAASAVVFGSWAWMVAGMGIEEVRLLPLFLGLSLASANALLLRKDRAFLRALVMSAAPALISWITVVIIGLGARASADAANIYELSVLYLQSGLLPSSINRGLLAPGLTALNLNGYAYILWPLHVWLIVVLLGYHIGVKILRLEQRGDFDFRIATAVVLSLAVFLSTPIFQVATTYLSNHGLFALGVGLVSLPVVERANSEGVSAIHYVPLTVGSLCISLSRPEGLAVSLTLIAILALTSKAKLPSYFFVSVSLINSFLVAFWFVTINPERFNSLLAGAGFAGAALLALLVPLAGRLQVRKRIILVRAGLILLIIAVGIAIALDLDGFFAQVKNLALGAGGWGLTLPLILLSAILLLLRSPSTTTKNLIFLAAVLCLEFVALKYWSGQGLGRQGFADSINRMMLHITPLTIPIVFLATYEALVNAIPAKNTRTRLVKRTSKENTAKP